MKTIILVLTLLILSSVTAQLGYDNPNLPRIEAPSTSSGVGAGGNVSSVNSGDQCIIVNPTTGAVIITFNTSCAGAGIEGNLTNFTQLIDTPSSYSGSGGKIVRVNDGATELVFGANLNNLEDVNAGGNPDNFLQFNGFTSLWEEFDLFGSTNIWTVTQTFLASLSFDGADPDITTVDNQNLTLDAHGTGVTLIKDNLEVDNNVTADFFIGDGSLLTGISGGNSSWNQSLADTLYISQSDEGNLNVNSSDFWDNLDSPEDILIQNLSRTDINETLGVQRGQLFVVDANANWTNFPRPTSPLQDFKLVNNQGGVLRWMAESVAATPTWAQTLTQSRLTSGNNPLISSGDQIELTNTNATINATGSSGILNIFANLMTNILGDVNITGVQYGGHQIFSAYDSAGGTSINTSGVALPLGTVDREDSFYTAGVNNVTINTAGQYYLSYTATVVRAVGSTRDNTICWLERNGVELAGTTSALYIRVATAEQGDRNTGAGQKLASLATNDVILVKCRNTLVQTDNYLANASSLYLEFKG